jgi:hypothetical protein
MMKKLLTLALDAVESSEWRGHDIYNLDITQRGENRMTGYMECRNCTAYVQVDTNPPANGIDIGGTSVALNCPIAKESI